MKTELLKQLEQAELEKLRAIDRVKELKAQIAEAEKEPSIFELMPIGSVWCGWEVVEYDKRRNNGGLPVKLKNFLNPENTECPEINDLKKLIAEQRKLDAVKRFAQAASDYCKTHIFNNETLYDAFMDYKQIIEKEDKSVT